jgi:hypothetical protein
MHKRAKADDFFCKIDILFRVSSFGRLKEFKEFPRPSLFFSKQGLLVTRDSREELITARLSNDQVRLQ